MKSKETHERKPYEPPRLVTERLHFVTPVGGSGGVVFSGPFRGPPPDEGEGGSGG